MPSANENYWDSFKVTTADVERLYGFILEKAEPITTADLVRQLIEARVREEEERRARYSQTATLYQPKLEYEIGQRVIFSELDDAQGVVNAIRPGDNPRLDPFQVITVRFDDGATREFAAAYALPHPLNEDRASTAGASDLSPDDVVREYGDEIQELLIEQLLAEKDFIEQNDRWLLRGLLVNMNEGYLNIAEAAIEQANSALSTPELAQVLELGGGNTKRSNVLFTLEYILRHDNRFLDVGPRGEARWYLARLQPAEAREAPPLLRPAVALSTRVPLPPELETLIAELQDEEDRAAATRTANVPILSFALTYPHRRMGTLPLTPALRELFPETDNRSLLVTFVIPSSGAKISGWLVRDGNYVAGLKTFYDQFKLNPGAYVQVQKRAEPLTASIEYEPVRERSLWVRAARVRGGQLTFAQEKRPVAHKYDEEMLIVIGDQAALDQLQQMNRGDRPLEILLAEVFPELAKLSSAGRVHAKSLYSAVNFLRRAAPRAVFTALMQGQAFASVGGGYFMLETARDLVR